MTESIKTVLDIHAETALFDGQVQALAVTLYENERPPCGLSGLMDWHFRGAISQCIKAGAITGKVGECIYFPFTRHGSTYHVILAGAGPSDSPGKRQPPPPDTLAALQKNLVSLQLPQVCISKSDFGEIESDFFEKHLKGVPLWIAL